MINPPLPPNIKTASVEAMMIALLKLFWAENKQAIHREIDGYHTLCSRGEVHGEMTEV